MIQYLRSDSYTAEDGTLKARLLQSARVVSENKKHINGMTMPLSIMLMNIQYMYRRKWRYLTGRLMVLSIVLYEQFLHHTRINSCLNIQF